MKVNLTKEVRCWTDEELFDEIRDQITKSKVTGEFDREKTRAVSAEIARRKSLEPAPADRGRE